MSGGVSEYGRAIQLSAISIAPVLSALSVSVGPENSTYFGIGAALSIVVSMLVVYLTGRPFGIDISCTPTHLVNGERRPDVPSENRGNVLLQDSSNKIHGEVELSKLTQSFELEFDDSSGINVELENTPRAEHEYRPDENVLECESVSDYSFPIKIGVYPVQGVEEVGRYHSFCIRDRRSGRVLKEFDAINVSG